MSTQSDFLESICKLKTLNTIQQEYGKAVDDKLIGREVLLDSMIFKFAYYRDMIGVEKFVYNGFSGSYNHCIVTYIKDNNVFNETLPIELITFKE